MNKSLLIALQIRVGWYWWYEENHKKTDKNNDNGNKLKPILTYL